MTGPSYGKHELTCRESHWIPYRLFHLHNHVFSDWFVDRKNTTVMVLPRSCVTISILDRQWRISKVVVVMNKVLNGLKEGMTLFGECIATLVNSILLSVAYFLVLAPTALAARLVGKSFLDMKPRKSTWVDCLDTTQRHYRQF